MSNWYNWNHHFMVGNLIPKIKRGIKMIDWLYALTWPVRQLWKTIFDSFYQRTVRHAKFRNNIGSFEYILNEDYGFTYSIGYTGSIWIDQPDENVEVVYMWNEGETIPPSGATAYMYNASETDDKYYMWNEDDLDYDYSFIVYAPGGSVSSTNQRLRLNSLINEIKPAGTKFKITYLN